MKKSHIFLVVTIIIVLLGLITCFKTNHTNLNVKNLANGCDSEVKYLGLKSIELAKTEAEQEQGLMYRNELCENQGMLFIFDKDDFRSFWMKNTFISLDIVFIKSDGAISNIAKSTTPEQLYPTYNAISPSQYVLEVKSGHSKKYKITEGSYINLDKLLQIGISYIGLKN